MADIFFGKFSETISPERDSSVNSSEVISKKGINKKLIYAATALVIVGAILLVFL